MPVANRWQPSVDPVIFAACHKSVKRWIGHLLVLAAAALGGACSAALPPGVYEGADGPQLSFQLTEIVGVRDGNRMDAEIRFSDPAGSRLSIQLRLAIGVPTTVRDGSYRLSRGETQEAGQVRARSVTFLGGQSDPPNLGASLELLQQDRLRYRVRFPPTPVLPNP